MLQAALGVSSYSAVWLMSATVGGLSNDFDNLDDTLVPELSSPHPGGHVTLADRLLKLPEMAVLLGPTLRLNPLAARSHRRSPCYRLMTVQVTHSAGLPADLRPSPRRPLPLLRSLAVQVTASAGTPSDDLSSRGSPLHSSNPLLGTAVTPVDLGAASPGRGSVHPQEPSWVCAASGGGDGGSSGGGGSGGDGSNGGGGSDGDADDEEYLDLQQAEEMAAAKGIQLPEDFIAAASEGGLRRSVLQQYSAIAGGAGITAALVRAIPAFRDRLIADRMYFFKILAEVCIDSGEHCRGGPPQTSLPANPAQALPCQQANLSLQQRVLNASCTWRCLPFPNHVLCAAVHPPRRRVRHGGRAAQARRRVLGRV